MRSIPVGIVLPRSTDRYRDFFQPCVARFGIVWVLLCPTYCMDPNRTRHMARLGFTLSIGYRRNWYVKILNCGPIESGILNINTLGQVVSEWWTWELTSCKYSPLTHSVAHGWRGYLVAASMSALVIHT